MHADPVSGSRRRTLADGTIASRLEFDPLGNEAPLADPDGRVFAGHAQREHRDELLQPE